MAKPGPPRALHYLHSERLEGLLVKGSAAPHVPYSQGQVVDRRKRYGKRHAFHLRARSSGNIPERWAPEPERTPIGGFSGSLVTPPSGLGSADEGRRTSDGV